MTSDPDPDTNAEPGAEPAPSVTLESLARRGFGSRLSAQRVTSLHLGVIDVCERLEQAARERRDVAARELCAREALLAVRVLLDPGATSEQRDQGHRSLERSVRFIER